MGQTDTRGLLQCHGLSCSCFCGRSGFDVGTRPVPIKNLGEDLDITFSYGVLNATSQLVSIHINTDQLHNTCGTVHQRQLLALQLNDRKRHGMSWHAGSALNEVFHAQYHVHVQNTQDIAYTESAFPAFARAAAGSLNSRHSSGLHRQRQTLTMSALLVASTACYNGHQA